MVTLLFGVPRYQEVAEAYIAGLEDRIAQHQPLEYVASVASFFLSRIDVSVDQRLDPVIRSGGPKGGLAAGCRGQTAIASAKITYRRYRAIVGGERF